MASPVALAEQKSKSEEKQSIAPQTPLPNVQSASPSVDVVVPVTPSAPLPTPSSHSPQSILKAQSQVQVTPGLTGYCVVCRSPSNYRCKDTDAPVCSLKCKETHITNLKAAGVQIHYAPPVQPLPVNTPTPQQTPTPEIVPVTIQPESQQQSGAESQSTSAVDGSLPPPLLSQARLQSSLQSQSQSQSVTLSPSTTAPRIPQRLPAAVASAVPLPATVVTIPEGPVAAAPIGVAGIAGHCFQCGQGANYICSVTDVVVCSKACKEAHLIAVNLPVNSPPRPLTTDEVQAKENQETKKENEKAQEQQRHVQEATPVSVVAASVSVLNEKEAPLPLSTQSQTNINANNAVAASNKPPTDETKSVAQHEHANEQKDVTSNGAVEQRLFPVSTPAAKRSNVIEQSTPPSSISFAAPLTTTPPKSETPSVAASPLPPLNLAVSSTPALPVGWEQCVDPKSGRTFYKNHNDKTSHWRLPKNISTAATPAHQA